MQTTKKNQKISKKLKKKITKSEKNAKNKIYAYISMKLISSLYFAT